MRGEAVFILLWVRVDWHVKQHFYTFPPLRLLAAPEALVDRHRAIRFLDM